MLRIPWEKFSCYYGNTYTITDYDISKKNKRKHTNGIAIIFSIFTCCNISNGDRECCYLLYKSLYAVFVKAKIKKFIICVGNMLTKLFCKEVKTILTNINLLSK